jgi:hypothetical protein
VLLQPLLLKQLVLPTDIDHMGIVRLRVLSLLWAVDLVKDEAWVCQLAALSHCSRSRLSTHA